MGIFDVASPLLSWLDAALAPLLPPAVRLVGWGLLGAAASMGIYAKTSPQRRLRELRLALGEARAALASYDGPFRGLRPRLRRMVALSLRQVGLTAVPALLASLPLLLLLPWVGNTHEYQLPPPGTPTTVQIAPAEAAVRWQPSGAAARDGAGWQVRWPAPSAPARLVDARGGPLLTLPPPAPVPSVTRRRLDHLLFGNPAGYLAASGPVAEVALSLPRPSYLPVGPPWLRGATALACVAAAIGSLLLKLLLRLR